jgi:hypothetical protein
LQPTTGAHHVNDFQILDKARQFTRLHPDPAVQAMINRGLDSEAAKLRVPLSFIIGWQGSEREHLCGGKDSDYHAMSAAWMAIGYGSVDLSAFCEPGTLHPDDVVRKSLRGACAEWVERDAQCRPLAAAIRAIRVTQFSARYTPTADSPTIITGLEG